MHSFPNVSQKELRCLVSNLNTSHQKRQKKGKIPNLNICKGEYMDKITASLVTCY